MDFSSLSNDSSEEKRPAAVSTGSLRGRLVGLSFDPMEKSSAKPVDTAENEESPSDGNLKEVLAKNIDILDDYAKIDAYAYKYNNKAQAMYGNDKAVDDKVHVGPMAQELEKTKSTNAVVSKDENGYEMVDTRKLTLSNTAAIAELTRKVQELESKLGGK